MNNQGRHPCWARIKFVKIGSTIINITNTSKRPRRQMEGLRGRKWDGVRRRSLKNSVRHLTNEVAYSQNCIASNTFGYVYMKQKGSINTKEVFIFALNNTIMLWCVKTSGLVLWGDVMLWLLKKRKKKRLMLKKDDGITQKKEWIILYLALSLFIPFIENYSYSRTWTFLSVAAGRNNWSGQLSLEKILWNFLTLSRRVPHFYNIRYNHNIFFLFL